MVMGEASVGKEAMVIWENKGSPWRSWMNKRHVDGKSLDTNVKKGTNSADWKAILASRHKIRRCANLGSINHIEWKGRGGCNYWNIYRTLRIRKDEDP